MDEKSHILPIPALYPRKQPSRRAHFARILPPLVVILYLSFAHLPQSFLGRTSDVKYEDFKGTGSCPIQPSPISVGKNWDPKGDSKFVERQVERLRGAIAIPTQSYDDMGVAPDDKRLEHLGDLGQYLEDTFPLTHDESNGVKLELIKTYARLYTWEGQKKHLKPIVFMAHMDVVPVNLDTLSQWTYPPFSGHLDKEGWIWGRGAADCKNTLIASLSAIEQLLSEDSEYRPTRTIILSFGYDEEIGGSRSAQYLAQALLERYGENGIAMILDEGFTGIDEAEGFGLLSLDAAASGNLGGVKQLENGPAHNSTSTQFARLGLMEKGSFSLLLEVFTPGGHSSVPPTHTAIGIIALLVSELESNPFPLSLEKGSPVLGHLQCLDEYAGDNVGWGLRGMIRDKSAWGKLADKLGEEDATGVMKAWLGTTQAVDLVSGGIKLNALPEYAQATINYRISFLSSPQEAFERVANLIGPLVKSHNLTFRTNTTRLPSALSSPHSNIPEDGKVPFNNLVRLSLTKEGSLRPAPPTPTEGAAWNFMGGTVRGVFGEETVISPSGMIANTDTKWYWDTTKAIYRWVPASTKLLKGFHTVDERAHVDAHLSSLKFYYQLVRNTEAWAED